METVGIARLTRTIPSQRAISASVSRREINAALDDTDGIPELRLDVISVDRGERGTISMTWSRDELERLLEAASENEVVLTFDEAELASCPGRRRGARHAHGSGRVCCRGGRSPRDRRVDGERVDRRWGGRRHCGDAHRRNRRCGWWRGCGGCVGGAFRGDERAVRSRRGRWGGCGGCVAGAFRGDERAVRSRRGRWGGCGGCVAGAFRGDERAVRSRRGRWGGCGGCVAARSEAMNEQYGLGAAGGAAAADASAGAFRGDERAVRSRRGRWGGCGGCVAGAFRGDERAVRPRRGR